MATGDAREKIGVITLHRDAQGLDTIGFYNEKESQLVINGKNVPMHSLAIEIGPEMREYLMVKIPLRYLFVEVVDGQTNPDV